LREPLSTPSSKHARRALGAIAAHQAVIAQTKAGRQVGYGGRTRRVLPRHQRPQGFDRRSPRTSPIALRSGRSKPVRESRRRGLLINSSRSRRVFFVPGNLRSVERKRMRIFPALSAGTQRASTPSHRRQSALSGGESRYRDALASSPTSSPTQPKYQAV